MQLKKRFASRISVTNFDEKNEDASNDENSDSDSIDAPLNRKRSIKESYVKKLIVKGKSEFQIALRKRFAGAKSSIETVKQINSNQ